MIIKKGQNRVSILYMLIASAIYGQTEGTKPDTIFCTSTNTSYIIFNEKVDLVNIGNPEDYFAQIEDRSVFVKSAKVGVQPSTILVKSGSEYYFGIVADKANNKTFFYPYKSFTSGSAENNNTAGTNESPDATREQRVASPNIANPDATLSNKSTTQKNTPHTDINQNLNKIAGIKTELSTLGFVSTYIDAALTVIRNDEKNTYIKILVNNKSSIPYKLDFISFQYFQHMARGFSKKGKSNTIDVFPAGQPTVSEIPPLKTMILTYAIPSFGLADKGYLMILFREISGDRVLKIKVNGSEIQAAKILE